MKKEKLIVFLLCCGYTGARSVQNDRSTNETSEFARDFTPCHYKDTNVKDCIQKFAENAKTILAKGVPSFGIQPMEPLKVPSIRLRQHHAPGKGFKYDAWLSDVAISGLTDYTINKLDLYPEQLRLKANVTFPRLRMGGEYVVLGTFQMLPIESTGKMDANFTSCTALIEASGARVHHRLLVRDAAVKLACAQPLQADLSNVHSVSGDMEKITDHIMGMHAAEILLEVQPAVETALAMVLEDVANKFLKHVNPDMVFAE